MYETIRLWNPREKINVKYTDGNGIKQIWSCNQSELVDEIIYITKQYKQMGIKLTGRQLYYQLVAKGLIPNATEVYKRLSKFATDGRYGGVFDWDAIEDRGRVNEKHADWSSVKSLIESALDAYRLPRWGGQHYYVEMLCEKQALESVLKPVADEWHVRFGYNKGYTSASSMYEMSKRVIREIWEGKHAVILYFGDHDPSGLDMVRDIEDRMVEFLTCCEDPQPLEVYEIEDCFTVHPLALTKKQIRSFNPPPNPAKFSDPRSKEYIAEHGQVSWELDAIDPKTLRTIAEEGILTYLDEDLYDEVVEQENEDAKALIEFGNSL